MPRVAVRFALQGADKRVKIDGAPGTVYFRGTRPIVPDLRYPLGPRSPVRARVRQGSPALHLKHSGRRSFPTTNGRVPFAGPVLALGFY